jgi:ATP-dependent Zn protease
MEKDERFIDFRGRLMSALIVALGAMACEQVFYGENSQGVGGDVDSATRLAATMVGVWGMGPTPVNLAAIEEDERFERAWKRLEQIGSTIMNRTSGPTPFAENPIGAVLGDPGKRRAAAQIIGQAYVMAFALMSANREPIERIADTLVERKEIYGDEVVELLNSAGLTRPQIDLMDDSTWPQA